MSAHNVRSKADLGQLLLLLQKQVAYVVQLWEVHRSADFCSSIFSCHIYRSAESTLLVWSCKCKFWRTPSQQWQLLCNAGFSGWVLVQVLHVLAAFTLSVLLLLNNYTLFVWCYMMRLESRQSSLGFILFCYILLLKQGSHSRVRSLRLRGLLLRLIHRLPMSSWYVDAQGLNFYL